MESGSKEMKNNITTINKKKGEMTMYVNIYKSIFVVGALSILCCFAGPANAQVIRWAGNVDVARPQALHAPDNRWTPVDPPIRVNDFATRMRYSGLAWLLGVSDDLLARAEVIAFEGNGGHGAGIDYGWESSIWTFSDGIRTATVTFNELVGAYRPDRPASHPAVLATGSLSNAAYSAFFGMCSPELDSHIVSYILFDLNMLSLSIDTTSPYFSIRIANGYQPDGSFGEGTPDPDAIGVFSNCPK
jgi:hypothetical protein